MKCLFCLPTRVSEKARADLQREGPLLDSRLAALLKDVDAERISEFESAVEVLTLTRLFFKFCDFQKSLKRYRCRK